MRLYRHLLKNSAAAAVVAAADHSPVLAVISALRKLCNSPSILMQQGEDSCRGTAASTSDDDSSLPFEGSLISSWLKGCKVPRRTVESAGESC